MNNLEFVHITKTGGTSIEDWGFKNNILWSYRNRKYFENFNFANTMIGNISKWHIPPQYFSNNPYDMKILFTVVRNPYNRIISEYYCPWTGSKYQNNQDIDEFNDWIETLLRKNTVVSGLPQYLYLPVNHVLRFESLQNDFTKMIRMYNKNIDTLLPHSNKSKFTQKKFTMDDLYKKTIEIINKKYKKDFELFDYDMIIV